MIRRLMLCIALVLAVAIPVTALAQQGPYNDKQNPQEYTDTEDSQVLKLVSYVLAPIGYVLEWTVTRPLHYVATKTPLAPVLSGDTEYSEIYNPSPTAEPIEPLEPTNTAASEAASDSSAPRTYIERSVKVPAPPAPLTTEPAQPALH